jgi:hypothetical protein
MIMELLTSPKIEYLLDASLESLHQESQEWLKEIAFWSDELAFFYRLVQEKEAKRSFPSDELARIEKELVRLSAEQLEKVNAGVLSHEKLLSVVTRSHSINEERVYREAHRRLLMEVFKLYADIRAFKKSVIKFMMEHEVA